MDAERGRALDAQTLGERASARDVPAGVTAAVDLRALEEQYLAASARLLAERDALMKAAIGPGRASGCAGGLNGEVFVEGRSPKHRVPSPRRGVAVSSLTAPPRRIHQVSGGHASTTPYPASVARACRCAGPGAASKRGDSEAGPAKHACTTCDCGRSAVPHAFLLPGVGSPERPRLGGANPGIPLGRTTERVRAHAAPGRWRETAVPVDVPWSESREMPPDNGFGECAQRQLTDDELDMLVSAFVMADWATPAPPLDAAEIPPGAAGAEGALVGPIPQLDYWFYLFHARTSAWRRAFAADIEIRHTRRVSLAEGLSLELGLDGSVAALANWLYEYTKGPYQPWVGYSPPIGGTVLAIGGWYIPSSSMWLPCDGRREHGFSETRVLAERSTTLERDAGERVRGVVDMPAHCDSTCPPCPDGYVLRQVRLSHDCVYGALVNGWNDMIADPGFQAETLRAAGTMRVFEVQHFHWLRRFRQQLERCALQQWLFECPGCLPDDFYLAAVGRQTMEEETIRVPGDDITGELWGALYGRGHARGANPPAVWVRSCVPAIARVP